MKGGLIKVTGKKLIGDMLLWQITHYKGRDLKKENGSIAKNMPEKD